MDSLLKPPIGFAHRGARAHARENTIEAFQLALRLGAPGLETDVWLTADGVPVLDHDGRVRRRAIARLDRTDLPVHIPTLAELFVTCGTDFDLSIDVKDAAAAGHIVEVTRAAGADLSRLWLCHHDWEQVAQWRELASDVRLVDSTRKRRMRDGAERRAAQLADVGIDAVNLHHSDWSAGLTTLFHRFDVLAFGWDAQHERVIASLLHMGIDGLYSDHVDRLVAGLEQAER